MTDQPTPEQQRLDTDAPDDLEDPSRPVFAYGPQDFSGPKGLADPEDPAEFVGEPGPFEDPVLIVSAGIVLACLAGMAWLLADMLLDGRLLVLAGVLAGLAAGCALLAALARFTPLRMLLQRCLAGAAAAAVALGLLVPALSGTGPEELAERAAVSTAALTEGDTVASVPGAPVLIRRADGSGELLGEDGVQEIAGAEASTLGLSADGAWLVGVGDGTSWVRSLAGGALGPVQELDGTLLTLTGDIAVLHRCAEGRCDLAGWDLAAEGADQELWSITAPEEARGQAPAGAEIALGGDSDAGADQEGAPEATAAVQADGVVPSAPVRFDPEQGWLWFDPTSGHPVGRVLSDPEQDCRVASVPAVETGAAQTHGPAAVMVCSTDDGVLTASGLSDGAARWTSEASPAGSWTVRLTEGAVLARGTEEGTDIEGEMVASSTRARWTASGGVSPPALRARIGLDGALILGFTERDEALAADTATGEILWTVPVRAADRDPRGALGHDGAVIVDSAPRSHPFDPRDAQRLRVLDRARGRVQEALVTRDPIERVQPLSEGRVLVGSGERLMLLVPDVEEG